ncbi:spore protein alpha/beta [Ammoniphilus oxalaticus]|uniref:Spore protein alpha/beta n=1 Tax=Ammoniphilus oxalaticus TaxID=66863 RepID=A0A419SKJ2_9BACL|nr:alpha/beta-type small acid-soluble spore protein [Ammoniphilus oxalaticus]RKD24428.1 spore protein alpha/beta [Ammoniphilus oxalaticus]
MSRNRLVVPEAENLMDRLKLETARELGLDDDIQEKGWGNMTTREVGKIGGNMVKKMIAFAQREMANHPDQLK